MSSSRILTLVLLLNLTMLGVLAYLVRQGAPGGEVLALVDAPPEAVGAIDPEREVVTVVQTRDFRWGQLESEDYQAYIARLREIGCPEQTIRDIIIADLDKLYAPRVESAVPRREKLNYWEPEAEELWNNVNQREIQRRRQEVDAEKRGVVRELLGVDLVSERARVQGSDDYYGRRLDFLPEEKRSEVRDIIEKYNHLELGLREKVWEEGLALTAEERAELKRIDQSRQAELAALLSPGELQLYDLWLSPSAATVRYGVYGMNATEGEFLGIFTLQKEFDQQWGPNPPEELSDLMRWEQARESLDTQLRGRLGTERYGAYQRGQDPEFHQINAVITRFDLPREAAGQLYEFKQIVTTEKSKLQADESLGPAQKRYIQQEMSRETESAVVELIGERAYKYLQRQGHGTWIHQ